MRVTVGMIVGLIAAGHSLSDILGAYPYLEDLDTQQALAYAAWRVERDRSAAPGCLKFLIDMNLSLPGFHFSKVMDLRRFSGPLVAPHLLPTRKSWTMPPPMVSSS